MSIAYFDLNIAQSERMSYGATENAISPVHLRPYQFSAEKSTKKHTQHELFIHIVLRFDTEIQLDFILPWNRNKRKASEQIKTISTWNITIVNDGNELQNGIYATFAFNHHGKMD